MPRAPIRFTARRWRLVNASGNTPMELMLVNLRMMGLIDHDLSRLKEYSEAVSRATHTPIPPNYPVVGRDAFRTATGVHAAAIVKAYQKE